jgi:sulfur carrier protein
VQVIVNDEPRVVDAGATVADLVASLGLGPRRIAVEVNRAVVPRADYGATALHDGDAVEIIHFVGGGLDVCQMSHQIRSCSPGDSTARG